MKKCFLMLAAFIIAASAFVSCTKDIKGDIDAINGKIDALTAQVTALDNQIKAGSVITNVENVAGVGVKVTLSNGKTFTLTDGKDADVWTVGEDGFWYKNGVKTANKAVGADGQKGDVYVPNADGYFYLNGEKTEYCWKAESVCAIFNEENGRLFLANIDGTDEVIELGTTPLSEILLDPFTVNEAGIAVYTIQGLADTAAVKSPVATNIIPVSILLNPSNIDVDDYDWAVRVAGAQTVKNIYSTTEMFNVVDVKEIKPGEAIVFVELNSDYFKDEDIDITLVEFFDGLMNPSDSQLLIQLQATNNLGQTISSEQGQLIGKITCIKQGGTIYPNTLFDFTVFDDKDVAYPVARAAAYTDSLTKSNLHIVDSVYLDASFPLTPVLVDTYWSVVKPSGTIDTLYFYSDVHNGIVALDQPKAVNAANAKLYAWNFPVYYDFEVAKADKDYVFINEAGYVSFDAKAQGKTVKIYMTPTLNGKKMVKDSIQIKVGGLKPSSNTVSLDLGDIKYSKILASTVSTNHMIDSVFKKAVKDLNLKGYTASIVSVFGDYGHSAIITPAYYTATAADTSFVLNSSVPFGAGSATYKFSNANFDTLYVNVIYNVVNDIDGLISLHEDDIYLSPVKSTTALTSGTFYDIKPFNLGSNVKKSSSLPAGVTLNYGLGKVDSLNFPNTAAKKAKIDGLATGNISLADTLDVSVYTVENAVVTANVPSQHWENNAWKTSTVAAQLEFPVTFINDLDVDVTDNIVLTTKGSFATDTIDIKDYVVVTTSNETIYEGAAVTDSVESINKYYAFDNSFITVELDVKSLPSIVAANGFVKQAPTGEIYWDELAAAASSYTQISDVPVKAKVIVSLGSDTTIPLYVVKEVTFILKNKFF